MRDSVNSNLTIVKYIANRDRFELRTYALKRVNDQGRRKWVFRESRFLKPTVGWEWDCY